MKVRRKLGEIMTKKSVSIDKAGKNIWQNVKESKKIRQEQKILISVFAKFLMEIIKN